MQEILSIVLTLVLIAVDLVVAFMFTFMIEEILSKGKLWFPLLLMITGIIFLQASVYSWLPKKLGLEFQLLDGAITLRDGALFSNLGALLIAQGVGIAFALAKHLWEVIRKKSRFLGAAFALELLFTVLFIVAGASLFKEDPVPGETVPFGKLAGLAALGTALLIAGIRTFKSRRVSA